MRALIFLATVLKTTTNSVASHIAKNKIDLNNIIHLCLGLGNLNHTNIDAIIPSVKQAKNSDA